MPLNPKAATWTRLARKSDAGNTPDARLRRMIHPGTGGYGYGLLRGLLPGSDYDYQLQAGDFWRNTAIAACLRVWKSNFPQPEMQVRKNEAEGHGKVVKNHALVALCNRPNPYYDRFALWSVFCVAALVDGNAYLMKIRSRAGIPVELWWVPPWMMRPTWDAAGTEYVTSYEYRVNGRFWYLDPADVIHFRFGGPDPRNERLAMSDLKAAAARVVCGLNDVDGYTAAIMRNFGVPPVVIRPAQEGGRINRDDAETLRAQWRERTTGERRGEPFVNPGSFVVEKLAFSPEELALDKIPARLEDQVCALSGVPPMLAGLTSGAQHKTYANYKEARRSFYEDALIPMQSAVAECLEHSLLDDPGIGNAETERIVFSYDRIQCLSEDQTEVYQRAALAYEKGLIRRSESRDMIGLEWGDEDEVYFVEPAAPVDADAAAETDDETIADEAGVTVEADAEPEDPEPEDDENAAKSLEGDDRRPFGGPQTKDNPPDRGVDGIIPGGDEHDPHEDNTYGLPDGKPLRRALKRWYAKIARQVLGTMPDIGVPLTTNWPALADYEDPMAAAFTPMISAYWDEAGKVTRERLGLDPDEWRVVDPNTHRMIETQAHDFCQSTLSTVRADCRDAYAALRHELVTGVITEGEAIPEITKRVQSIFTGLNKSHAAMIARTETARAVNAASLESAKQSGVVAAKKWLLSSAACPLCHEIADRVNSQGGIRLDEPFATGLSDKPTYATCSSPPAHPHCRCTTTYVLTPEYQAIVDANPPATFAPGAWGPEG